MGHHHQHVVVGVEESSLQQKQEEEEEEEEEEEKKTVSSLVPARLSNRGGSSRMMVVEVSEKSGEMVGGISPKSVISDVRFVSPGSSSSSSMERGLVMMGVAGATAAAAAAAVVRDGFQSKWLLPRHDRGYSISDGEISDSDSSITTFFDSIAAASSSRELAKIGSLESLPETHSLALDALRPNPASGAAAAEDRIASGKERTGTHRVCCSEFSPSALQGPSSSTSVNHKEVTQDLGKPVGMHGAENSCPKKLTEPLHALPNKVEFEEGKHWLSTNAAAAAAPLITGPRSGASTMKDLQTAAANFAEINVQASSTQSSNDWGAAAAASSDDYSAELLDREQVQYLRRSMHQDGGREAHTKLQGKRISAAGAASDSTTTTMEKPENVKTWQGSGTMGIFAYPRTPQRIFPGWQAFSGSPPIAGHIPAAAGGLRAGNGNGFYSSVISSSSEKDAGKGGRHLQQRFYSGPLLNPIVSKPTPSKWDDAEKWITSPGHHESPAHPQLRHAPVLLCSQPGRRHSIAGAQGLQSYEGAGSPEYSITSNAEKTLSPSNVEQIGISKGQRQVLSLVTQKKRSKTLSFGDLSKQFDDLSQAAAAVGAAGKFDSQPGDVLLFEGDRRAAEMAKVSIAAQSTSFRINKAGAIGGPPNLPQQLPQSVEESPFAKHVCGNIMEPGSLVPSLSDDACTKDVEFSSSVNLPIPRNGCSLSMKEIGTDPPTPPASHTPQPSIGHRDMATQITPTESLKNSTCTTPKVATSPTRNNTPAFTCTPSVSLGMVPGFDFLELKSCHLAKLELRKLGCDNEQLMLDRNQVLNSQEDDVECGAHVHQHNKEKSILVSEAAAWEKLELAKCTARYNDKEAKILAWEILEKSKAEVELKKTQVKLEKMRVRAIEKMQNRVAVVCQKAEEMRAAAKNIRNEKAAKTTARGQQIISTGRRPPSHKSFRCCFS